MEKIRISLVVRYRSFYEKSCDASVYIGGSIFIEYENWKQILNWWRYEAETYRFLVLGANFGPYHTEAYRKELAEILDTAEDVCLRDQYSYKMLKTGETVRYAPDILFSYPMPKQRRKRKTVFVSLIDYSLKAEGASAMSVNVYTDTLKNILKGYAEEGFETVLVSFCKEEGDESAVNQLKNQLDRCGCRKNVRMLFYNGTNSDTILQEIADSEYVIAGRFHAVILGMAAGKPVFPLIYSDKTLHVLQDIKFQGNIGDIRKPDLIDFEYSIRNYRENLITNIDKVKVQSEEHFRVLDRILDKQREK